MSDKTLTLSYGEFSCSFTGYEDPFPVLGRIFGRLDKSDQGDNARDWRSRILEAMHASANDSGAEFVRTSEHYRFSQLAVETREAPAEQASPPPSPSPSSPPPQALSRKPQVRIVRGAKPPASVEDPVERGEVFQFNLGPEKPSKNGATLPLSRFVPHQTDNALPDLLESSIIWLSASVGREEFTNIEAMDALTSLEQETGNPKSGRFARLMAFQSLVETGRVRPTPNGLFAVTRDALCRYEQRLRA